MINIWTSNTSNASNELVISELGKKNIKNSNHIVFCPPNFGFSIEKQIYEQLGLEGTFNIEVTSFARYSYQNLPATLPTLTTEGGILITKKIILQNKAKLRYFKKMLENISFAEKMYTTIRKLRQNGYDSLFLQARGEEIKGATGDKLKEIALIMEAFNKEVITKYIDNITRLELLAKNIEKDEKVKGTHIYFMGFSHFSAQELEVIKAFAKNALSVNIGTVSGMATPNAAYFQNRVRNQLSNLESEGVEIGEEVVGVEVLKGTSQILHDEVLSYRENPKSYPSKGNVLLFEEGNVFEEINGVAHEIVRLVRREGYRYKDINIISCSPEYRNEISQIFSRYDIPCFIDIKYPLSQALSSSYLLRVIETAKSNYSKEKVIALMKHPLFFAHEDSSGNFSDDIFRYENFIYKNNIDYKLFLSEHEGEGKEFEYIRKRILQIVENLFVLKDVPISEEVEGNWMQERHDGKQDSEIDTLSLGEFLKESKEVPPSSSAVKEAPSNKMRKNLDVATASLAEQSNENLDVATASLDEQSNENLNARTASLDEQSNENLNARTASLDEQSNENLDVATASLDEQSNENLNAATASPGESDKSGEALKVATESPGEDEGVRQRSNEGRIASYVEACRKILGETSEVLGNFLTMYRAEKYVKGEENIEELNIRANKILDELFDIAIETIGEERVKLPLFEQYMKTLISQQSIGMLPRYLDSVFVGDLVSSYISRPPVVFVIGASQDNLLSGVSVGGILNNKDTAIMEKHLFPIYPSPKDYAVIEGFMFIDLMSKYTDKLYVGYSINNLLGEPQKPSEAFLEIASILDLKSVSLVERFSIERASSKKEIEDVAVSEANAYFTLVSHRNKVVSEKMSIKLGNVLSVIENSLEKERAEKRKNGQYNDSSQLRERSENDVLPHRDAESQTFTEKDTYLGVRAQDGLIEKEESKEEGYAQYFFQQNEHGDYMMSSSAIESFFTCPYAFFLQYGLRIREREMGEIAPVDIGNIVHEVLDVYFKSYVKISKKNEKLPEKQYIELIEKTIEKVFSGIKKIEVYERDPQSVVKLENLKRECFDMLVDLTNNVQKGSYIPTYFEKPFGMEGVPPVEIEIDGDRKILLRGRIDRIDIATKYNEKRALTIDYKTGGKDKGAMNKVFLGREIQPLIYLMAIQAIDDKVIPAGALYLVISDSLSKEGKKNKFLGQLITDEKNIKNLDTFVHELITRHGASKATSSVLPFSVKASKDGGIVPASSLYPLDSEEKMSSLLNWIRELIQAAFKEIDLGYLDKTPFEDGCKFCYMKGACSMAKEENYRKDITSTEAVKLFNAYHEELCRKSLKRP